MFLPIGPDETSLVVFFNGEPLAARVGETVAACLLRANVDRFRLTPVSGAPRLPYCMIGQCFDCLVEIDGVGSRQACLVVVSDGMRISSQNGAMLAIEVIEQ